MMRAVGMNPEAADLKTWLAARLRGTNWAAAGISAALQGGVLAMLIMMGVVTTAPEGRRERLTVTSISAAPSQPQPAPPAQPRPQEENEPVVQRQVEAIVPPTKVQISTASPVAAAPERAPDPPVPAPGPPAAAPAAAAVAAPAGPVRVANIGANLSCPPLSYPPKAKFEHQEGTVIVEVALSAEGRVTEASLRRSSGFRLLDDAALSVVRQCRGTPRIQNGRAVDITGPVNIPFTLRKS